MYKTAYLKSFNGITDVIKILESETIITNINLQAVKHLKELQTELEALIIEDENHNI